MLPHVSYITHVNFAYGEWTIWYNSYTIILTYKFYIVQELETILLNRQDIEQSTNFNSSNFIGGLDLGNLPFSIWAVLGVAAPEIYQNFEKLKLYYFICGRVVNRNKTILMRM